MGYTTEFNGQFLLDAPLTPEQTAYLKKFSETRRMKRDAEKAATMPDPVRIAVGLPVGEEGSYFVGGAGYFGQDRDESIIDYNCAPGEVEWDAKQDGVTAASWAQPGLWCKWSPTDDGIAIEWNGAEKFYCYVEWLQYLVDHFFKRWGRRIASGGVTWQGEKPSDFGVMYVEGDVVKTRKGKRVYEGEE